MADEITPEVTEEVTPEPLETASTEAVEQEAPVEEVESSDSTEEPLILGKYKSVEDVEKALILQQQENIKLKRSQSDPNYVYELARKAGLTDAEAQAEANQVDVGAVVAQKLAEAKDYDKALTILPELGKDPKIEAWGYALVERGMTHEQAAKTIKDVLNKTTAEARVEGSKAAQAEISEKEAAQTAPTFSNVDPEASEIEQLRAQSKSLNRVEQTSALEKLILKNL